MHELTLSAASQRSGLAQGRQSEPANTHLSMTLQAATAVSGGKYAADASQYCPIGSTSTSDQNALLITPPSTRSAAPVVAEASGLAM
jgi:hypothetical protein